MTKRRNNTIFFGFIVFLLLCGSVAFLVEHHKKIESAHSGTTDAVLLSETTASSETEHATDAGRKEGGATASRVEKTPSVKVDKPVESAERTVPKKQNLLDRIRHRSRTIFEKLGF